MKHPLFHSATLRLTAWYTLILLFISLLFSVIVFQISSHEIGRNYRPPRPNEIILNIENDDFLSWRQQRIEESRSRLVGQLIFFNILVLSAGAAGSYLLARRTLQPVEDALEAQTRFSSDAAHELRTPLTIMQSEIEVGLRDKAATKNTHTALLKSNLDEVQRMRTLTDRLLLLANNHDMPLTPTSIENVAIEAVNQSVSLAQTKKIAIENKVKDISVLGNADSLTDVIVILLENAIKYSPAKSTITLASTVRGKHAELTVEDMGPGISEADLAHIFDRFYRADTSRSSQNVSGHGLGLSIAKQIISAHHGHINAKNNGKGTTFTIALALSSQALKRS